MFNRMKTAAGAIAALGALALGGAAIAGATQSPSSSTKSPSSVTQAPASPTAEQPGQETNDGASGQADTDNVQSGDQSAPDTASASGSEAAGENADSETAGENADSETATNSDGPGGHADEPGNANADHQAQGQE